MQIEGLEDLELAAEHEKARIRCNTDAVPPASLHDLSQ